MTFVVTKQRAQEVHDLARARAGNYYGYGEAFTYDPARSTDCSGLVLQTAAWYGGRDDWSGNRYGSTESFRLDHATVYNLGFKRLRGGVESLGFTPVMLVGLQHGGGGVYSHTACTLMTMDIPGGPVKVSKRGVDWESRGGSPGVRLYDGARAWDDPLFHDFWYLDAKLEDAGLPDAAGVLADATGLSLERAAEILPIVQEGLRASECVNPSRIAMWLAQIGHESAGFNATEEYAKNGRYAPYIGRTWIQITWDYNYKSFSEWCYSKELVPTDRFFLDNPEKLADLKWAGIGAAWYWTQERPTINSLADALDLYGVTRLINGGTNGIEDRKQRYDRARALGGDLLKILDDTEELDEWEAVLADNTLYPTTSPYRPDDKPILSIKETIRQTNGMVHAKLVEDAALQGLPEAIKIVAKLAKGEGPGANDKFKVAQAQNIIRIIQARIAAQTGVQ